MGKKSVSVTGLKKPTRDLEDLKWLVKSRSQNQASSVELYKLFQIHKEIFVDHKIFRNTAQSLLGVNFSLWRAVFLTDIDRQQGMMMADAEIFLKNLIENNTIAYQQDKNANYWTFRFYLNNARTTLKGLKRYTEEYKIVRYLPDEDRGMNAQDWWSVHQNALDSAIVNFEKALLKEEEEEDKVDDEDVEEDGGED